MNICYLSRRYILAKYSGYKYIYFKCFISFHIKVLPVRYDTRILWKRIINKDGRINSDVTYALSHSFTCKDKGDKMYININYSCYV